MLLRSYHSQASFLNKFLKLRRQSLSRTDAIWHVPAFEFVELAILRFIFPATQGVAGYAYFDPGMTLDGGGGSNGLSLVCMLRGALHFWALRPWFCFRLGPRQA